MNITVYLGSRDSNRESFRVAVRELGAWIAKSGHSLVYGGSSVGLMGMLADAALANGGKVYGYEVDCFVGKGWDHHRLTDMKVFDSMPARKTALVENGDVYVCFPGGAGTLEEMADAISLLSWAHYQKHVIVYNLEGYYDHLYAQILHMVSCDLHPEKDLKNLHFVRSLEEVTDIIHQIEKGEI